MKGAIRPKGDEVGSESLLLLPSTYSAVQQAEVDPSRLGVRFFLRSTRLLFYPREVWSSNTGDYSDNLSARKHHRHLSRNVTSYDSNQFRRNARRRLSVPLVLVPLRLVLVVTCLSSPWVFRRSSLPPSSSMTCHISRMDDLMTEALQYKHDYPATKYSEISTRFGIPATTFRDRFLGIHGDRANSAY